MLANISTEQLVADAPTIAISAVKIALSTRMGYFNKKERGIPAKKKEGNVVNR